MTGWRPQTKLSASALAREARGAESEKAFGLGLGFQPPRSGPPSALPLAPAPGPAGRAADRSPKTGFLPDFRSLRATEFDPKSCWQFAVKMVLP